MKEKVHRADKQISAQLLNLRSENFTEATFYKYIRATLVRQDALSESTAQNISVSKLRFIIFALRKEEERLDKQPLKVLVILLIFLRPLLPQ